MILGTGARTVHVGQLETTRKGIANLRMENSAMSVEERKKMEIVENFRMREK